MSEEIDEFDIVPKTIGDALDNMKEEEAEKILDEAREDE